MQLDCLTKKTHFIHFIGYFYHQRQAFPEGYKVLKV